MYSVLDKFHRDYFSLNPYPHCVIEDCLPDHFYNELVECYPDWNDLFVGDSVPENTRHDWHAKDVFKHGSQIWREFIAYHTSNEFFQQVMDCFEDSIYLAYPALKWQNFRDIQTGTRFIDKAPIVLDAQVGCNTPTTTASSVRGPHVDNPIELFAGLLYMPIEGDTAGGDLIVYDQNKKPEIYGKAEIKDYTCKEVNRVPYKPNTFVMFINTINSNHGVSVRQPTEHPRRLVNFIGESTQGAFFNYEQFRVEKR